MTRYEIPTEFQDRLEVVKPRDERSDDEVIKSLKQHVRVTSEKNIWAFWHGGLDHIPPWCLRNVINWARICGPEWTIRVLDTVPDSPNNVLKFAPEAMLPRCFVEGTMTGPYEGQHSSDLVCGSLLYTHGGIKMDVGCILTRDAERSCWAQLEDPNSPYEIAAGLQHDQYIINHFIAARKGSPFIKRHDLYAHLWKDRTNCENMSDDPLLFFVKEYSLAQSSSNSLKWDFKVPLSTVLDYTAQIACWRRICMLEGTLEEPFNGSEYWQKHILLINAREEHWRARQIVGNELFGQRLFDLMPVKLDADPSSQEYKKAYETVWTILADTSMQKISRGTALTNSPTPGTLWDQKPGMDCLPGTFGDLLHYGAVHFRQKRENVTTMEAKPPGYTLKKGLFEV